MLATGHVLILQTVTANDLVTGNSGNYKIWPLLGFESEPSCLQTSALSVGPHVAGFLHAGLNFRKPVPGTTCHTQCVGYGCRNLLAKTLGLTLKLAHRCLFLNLSHRQSDFR